MRFKGWLLDPYIREKHAFYWFKTLNGEAVKVQERCHPAFTVKPVKKRKPAEVAYLFDSHPFVHSTSVVERYPTLDRSRRVKAVEVRADMADDLPELLRFAEKLEEVEEVYDSGLIPVQWHLIRRRLPPTSLCEVEASGGALKRFTVLDDSTDVEPPGFKPLLFAAPEGWKVDEIRVLDETLAPVTSFKGEEPEVLAGFHSYLQETDPDILVTYSPLRTVKKLLKRAQRNRVQLALGRGGDPLRGRALIGVAPFLDTGVAGLVERSRFTFAPLGVSADWAAGKTIDSRQCYEANRLGVMVPPMKGGYTSRSTAWEMVQRDRGGMLFSPQVGLHENVAALDFESMFPNIIVKRNVSYETVTEEGVRTDLPGFMGGFTGEFLDRRLYFKHLRRQYPRGSREWWLCQQRQAALKLMLVVVYGYSGCYANRFANVRVFQEINRQARHGMVKALNVALRHGYDVIYGDTDSLFMKRPGATRRDFEELAEVISEEVGLPMGLDRHFRYLVLLNKSTDTSMVASRRYYGKLTDGNLFYRGIELRRHDSPPFIKDLQTSVMETLFDADSAEQVLNTQLPEALELADREIRRVRRGKVPAERLVISKRLRRDIDEYRSLQPHIVAAMLGESEEDESSYLLVNTGSSNPYTRVMPASMLDGKRKAYDRKKYAELTRRATWNLLRPFVPDEETIGGARLRESRLDTYT